MTEWVSDNHSAGLRTPPVAAESWLELVDAQRISLAGVSGSSPVAGSSPPSCCPLPSTPVNHHIITRSSHNVSSHRMPPWLGHRLTHSHREVLLGITGKDFVLIAASKAAMRGATILKAADDKTRPLTKHTLLAFSGEAGDTGMGINVVGVVGQELTPLQSNSPSTSKEMPSSTRCATRPICRPLASPTLSAASWPRACAPDTRTTSTC